MADDEITGLAGDEAEAGDGGADVAAAAARDRDSALRALQAALLTEIDATIDRLARARLGESTREHLDILRSLLKAQVDAYLGHFVSRRATLFSQTSTMYAGEVGAPGVISTTLRGLLDGGTLTTPQAAKLSGFLTERRTLVIFGDRATGKSTLLNSLFELIPLDERFVAIERGPDLPALKERSFCVRLSGDRDSDVAALFAKARRMNPGRLVVGEIYGAEIPEFFRLLAADPRVGGLATLRAETVHKAVDAIVAAFPDAAEARQALAAVRPVFVHMHSDEKGLPRLAALWSLEGAEDGELALTEVRTPPPPATSLAAEV